MRRSQADSTNRSLAAFGKLQHIPMPSPPSSPHQKLVVFTEHRGTLTYLHDRIPRLATRSGSRVLARQRANTDRTWTPLRRGRKLSPMPPVNLPLTKQLVRAGRGHT